jgi:hypothetical protein
MLFWVKSPCGLIGSSQQFEDVCHLHLQPWRWRQHASPKRWLLPTNPHGDLTQKSINRRFLTRPSGLRADKEQSRRWKILLHSVRIGLLCLLMLQYLFTYINGEICIFRWHENLYLSANDSNLKAALTFLGWGRCKETFYTEICSQQSDVGLAPCHTPHAFRRHLRESPEMRWSQVGTPAALTSLLRNVLGHVAAVTPPPSPLPLSERNVMAVVHEADNAPILSCNTKIFEMWHDGAQLPFHR